MNRLERSMEALEIHNLAVLRAAVEGKPLRSYFGSFMGLSGWIASTRVHGLIDEAGNPTALGVELAKQLALTDQEAGRAYLWRGATDLVARARGIHQGLAA
ncbi:hypothetical protein [Ottowia sp.]|uniref:hypothetical protein n=1 Tax=Ottowia sp. TaxID=1898956 RepID=UPI0025CF7E3D|nr:hypothetical protein [Ottowia sp.]MBK6616597.1 hypothetical protein [Ottowia sp.]